MNCRKSRQIMATRLAGQLRPELARAHDAHLAYCPRCQAIWHAQLAVDRSLHGVAPTTPPPTPPPDLRARLEESLKTDPRLRALPRQRARPWRRWLFGGLAMVLLAPCCLVVALLASFWLVDQALISAGHAEAAMMTSRTVQWGNTATSLITTLERWLALGLLRGTLAGVIFGLLALVTFWLVMIRRWGRHARY
jgi:anti-sigma factor RsiW